MRVLSPTRRDVLKIAAFMPALTLPVLALPARAATLGPPTAQGADIGGVFRFALGQASLTVVSDGHLNLPVSGLGINADPEQVQALLTRHYLSPTTGYAHTNHLFIEIGSAKLLIDVGSGSRFLDTAGRLLRNLDRAGIDPSEITHVVITHAHPDHIWGVRDDFDEAVIPGASYYLGEAEHGYWMQDDLVNTVPAEQQQFVLGAVNSINVEGADWTLVTDGQEIVPGVRIVNTPGHTPGHLSVMIESDGQQLLALGDAMSHVWTNFAHPEWYNAFDMDGEQTVATRRRLLDMAATDGVAVLGYHFPFPGVGHVLREGGAYRFVPATWQW